MDANAIVRGLARAHGELLAALVNGLNGGGSLGLDGVYASVISTVDDPELNLAVYEDASSLVAALPVLGMFYREAGVARHRLLANDADVKVAVSLEREGYRVVGPLLVMGETLPLPKSAGMATVVDWSQSPAANLHKPAKDPRTRAALDLALGKATPGLLGATAPNPRDARASALGFSSRGLFALAFIEGESDPACSDAISALLAEAGGKAPAAAAYVDPRRQAALERAGLKVLARFSCWETLPRPS